jgi:hypothetical protein
MSETKRASARVHVGLAALFESAGDVASGLDRDVGESGRVVRLDARGLNAS